MDPRCQCEKVVADSVGQDKKAGGGVRGGVQTERRREGGVRGQREGRGGSSLLPGVQLHAMRFCGGGSVGSPLWPLFLAACLLRSSPSLDGDGKRFHRAFLPSQRRKGGSYSTVQYSTATASSARRLRGVLGRRERTNGTGQRGKPQFVGPRCRLACRAITARGVPVPLSVGTRGSDHQRSFSGASAAVPGFAPCRTGKTIVSLRFASLRGEW